MKSYLLPILTLIIINISSITSLAAKELNFNNYKSIYNCHLLNKRYTFAVSNELYEKMTQWNIESDRSPPTSPQKAFQLAKNRLDKIGLTEGSSWIFEGATLQPIKSFLPDKKWIWKITFRHQPKGGFSSAPVRMKFLVTMDGVLVEPIITNIR